MPSENSSWWVSKAFERGTHKVTHRARHLLDLAERAHRPLDLRVPVAHDLHALGGETERAETLGVQVTFCEDVSFDELLNVGLTG
jgi:hypothetical protein